MSSVRRFAGLPAGRRSKYAVLVFWILAFMAAGPLAGKLTDVQKNDTAEWLPGSAESTAVYEQATAFTNKNVFTAVVVYERDSGLTAADRAKAAADATALSAVDGVTTIAGPTTADDGKAIRTVVPVDLGDTPWSAASGTAERIRDIVGGGPAGLTAQVTGPLGYAADSADAFGGIDGVLLFGTILVVVVLLLITYRSPILWLLPVLTAGISLMASQGVIYLLAKNAGLTVNAQSAGILTVLVFGAATDYALLLIARYREELRRHPDRHDAMRIALRRAGPAVIASAATVAAGLLTMAVAEMNSTRSLGPVLAIGIGVGLLAMITLLPALLVICGRWVFWPVKPKLGSTEPTASGFWARTGATIARRPRAVWLAAVVVLGALAFGSTGLSAHGLTQAESFTNTPESVRGEEALARHFAAGVGSPIVVVGAADAAAGLRSALAGVDGVTDVTEPRVRGDRAYLEGTLLAAPDSAAAYDTVDATRAAVHAVPDGDAKVGGASAISLDSNRAAGDDRSAIIPIALLVVFAILALLLRAVVAPLLLIATVVLSFGAALGISTLAFEHVFGWTGADSSFPLFVFVYLVALGIDYNIFLMTRVREESQRVGTRRGAVTGLAATGAVITSAGAVLASTFAILGTLPLVFFAELGFAVAVGVLLDTFVVRSVLVTALNVDLGDRIWWPSRLAAGPAAAATETVPEQREPVAAP